MQLDQGLWHKRQTLFSLEYATWGKLKNEGNNFLKYFNLYVLTLIFSCDAILPWGHIATSHWSYHRTEMSPASWQMEPPNFATQTYQTHFPYLPLFPNLLLARTNACGAMLCPGIYLSWKTSLGINLP